MGLLGGFGHHISPILICDYYLTLLRGQILELTNYCYDSCLTVNIIYVDALFEQWDDVVIKHGVCSIWMNKCFIV